MNEFDKLLEKATTGLKVPNPNRQFISSLWSLILRDKVDSKYALNALKLKLFSTNECQALKVLRILKIMEEVFGFVRENLLSREFWNDLQNLAQTTKHEELRRRVLQQMHAWNFKFRNNPKNEALKDTINLMKLQGFKFPKEWVDGNTCHNCYIELIEVYPFKNHCHACGQIFCDLCSTKTATISEYGTKKVCVCDFCFEQVQADKQSSIISSNNKADSGSSQSIEVNGLHQSTAGSIFVQNNEETCSSYSSTIKQSNPTNICSLTRAHPISSIFCHRNTVKPLTSISEQLSNSLHQAPISSIFGRQTHQPCLLNSRTVPNTHATTPSMESFGFLESLPSTEVSGCHQSMFTFSTVPMNNLISGQFSNNVHRTQASDIFGRQIHQPCLLNSRTLPNTHATTTTTGSFGFFESLPSTEVSGCHQSIFTFSTVPINNSISGQFSNNVHRTQARDIFGRQIHQPCLLNSKTVPNTHATTITGSFGFLESSPSNRLSRCHQSISSASTLSIRRDAYRITSCNKLKNACPPCTKSKTPRNVVETKSFDFANSSTIVKSDDFINFFKQLDKRSALDTNNDSTKFKKYSNDKIPCKEKIKSRNTHCRNRQFIKSNTLQEKLQPFSAKNETDDNKSPEETERLRELKRAEKIRLMKKKCEKYLQYQKEHAEELYKAKEI